MRILFVAFIALFHFTSCAQKKVDLTELKLTEQPQDLMKNIAHVNTGNMFDRSDMISYGIDQNNTFYFKNYLPDHIELLSYKGQLAGYAFKIKSFEEQEKIEQYFNQKYKDATVQKSKWLTLYKYAGNNMVIELSAITKEQFDQKMNGYYSVKRADFSTEYQRLLK